MKAIAIDSAVTKLNISAKNDDYTVSCSYDIGMKQSETLLPAIQYVLEKAGINKKELDYLAMTSGPGSFTGLRLSYAALKAIELSFNIPLYGISTLEVYAEPYKNLPFLLISCVDAKKERFYAKIYNGEKIILDEGDWEISDIAKAVNESEIKKDILICGSDAHLLKEQLNTLVNDRNIYSQDFSTIPAEALYKITEEKIQKKEPPLNDYDGPVYLRASEAEVNLSSK